MLAFKFTFLHITKSVSVKHKKNAVIWVSDATAYSHNISFSISIKWDVRGFVIIIKGYKVTI